MWQERASGFRTRRVALFILILSGSFFCHARATSAAARFKQFVDKAREETKKVSDAAKQTVRQTEQKWKESERRCVDCGKVIHMGERCAACEAKRVSESARQTVQQTKEKWKESEHRCIDCGKIIHAGDRCAACEAKRLSQGVKQTANRSAEAARGLKRTWDENKDTWKAQARSAAENSARYMQEVANDPQKRKELLDKAVTLQRGLELTAIRAFPTIDPDTAKIVTFDTLMRKMVNQAGVGGSLGADPVGTAFLLMVDSNYLFDGARLIAGPSGEYVTLNEALLSARSSSGFFDNAALQSASQSYSRIRSAYSRGDAATLSIASRDFAGSITRLNQDRPAIGSLHVVLWTKADARVMAIASFFQDSHRALAAKLREMGVERDLCEWIATGVIVVGCLLALLAVCAVLRAGLKAKLRRVSAELEELKNRNRV